MTPAFMTKTHYAFTAGVPGKYWGKEDDLSCFHNCFGSLGDIASLTAARPPNGKNVTNDNK